MSLQGGFLLAQISSTKGRIAPNQKCVVMKMVSFCEKMGAKYSSHDVHLVPSCTHTFADHQSFNNRSHMVVGYHLTSKILPPPPFCQIQTMCDGDHRIIVYKFNWTPIHKWHKSQHDLMLLNYPPVLWGGNMGIYRSSHFTSNHDLVVQTMSI